MNIRIFFLQDVGRVFNIIKKDKELDKKKKKYNV